MTRLFPRFPRSSWSVLIGLGPSSPVSHLSSLAAARPDSHGQAYEATGNADSAIVAYERFDRARFTYYPAPGWPEIADVLASHAVWRAWIYRRLGELHEARGTTDKAIEYFSKYVDLYQNADDALQPRVEEARQRIARGRGEPAAV